ncbi:hypothetical protein ACWFRX_10675 [Streptomyces sp. NPDC055100]|uniref:hypothetical protein n=1 Tax=Streptomyces sp. NPDC127532 TaxID=3345399 RepID=UPI00362ECA46
MTGRSNLTNHCYRKDRAAFPAADDISHIRGHPAADVIDRIRPITAEADPRDRGNWPRTRRQPLLAEPAPGRLTTPAHPKGWSADCSARCVMWRPGFPDGG